LVNHHRFSFGKCIEKNKEEGALPTWAIGVGFQPQSFSARPAGGDKTPSIINNAFPYFETCPEPVLANDRFQFKSTGKGAFRRTDVQRPHVRIDRDQLSHLRKRPPFLFYFTYVYPEPFLLR